MGVVVALAIGASCGKKDEARGGGAATKTTVYTVDDPGFSVDIPEGWTEKRRRGDKLDVVGYSQDFEGKGVRDNLSVYWKKASESLPADEMIAAEKANFASGEPDLKATLVEGQLPGGGLWVSVGSGKRGGTRSWLVIGDVLVSCQGSGGAREVCKQLRAN